LWQFFRTSFFWGPGNAKLKPVVILDQFEEFFTSYSKEKRKAFIRNLADLVSNTVPGELLASFQTEKQLQQQYNLVQPGVKIIISIREDFLGQLEEMSKNIPAILNHRFRLMPLTRQQAKQAIIEPSQLQHEAIQADSFKFTPEAVDMILDFLCKQRERDEIKISDEVEPFQLQILCRHLEEKSRERRKRIEDVVTIGNDDLGGEKGMQQVLQQFYEDQLKKYPFMKRIRIRRLFEKGLISIDDRRVIRDEGEIIRYYKVSRDILIELIHKRLLRPEPRAVSIYYELSHDTMVEPIRKSQKNRTKKKKTIGLISLLLIAIVIIGLAWSQIQKQDAQIEKISENDRINKLLLNAKKLEKENKNKEAIEKYQEILKIDKTEANAYMGIGKLLDYDKAINIYESAISNGAKDKLIYCHLAEAYFKKGKIEEAIKCYEEALKISPLFHQAYEGLGDVYQSQKYFSKAIDNYEKYLRITEEKHDVPKPDVYKKLAICYINNDEHDKAIKSLKEAIEIDRNSADEAYYILGGVFLKDGKYSDAIEAYKNAIELNPYNADAHYNLGLAFFDNGKDNYAMDSFKKANEIKNIPNAYDLMGYILIKQEKYDSAIKSYQKAVEIAPNSRAFRLNLIEAYFVAGRFEDASVESMELLRSKTILEEEDKLSLQFIYISSLLFQEKHQEAFNSIEKFIDYYGSIRKNYERNWNYDLIKRFLRKNNNLPKQHLQILFIIIDILESNKEGDKKIKQLQSFIR
jgi:tetratricopeptide (TPR) repeat protein